MITRYKIFEEEIYNFTARYFDNFDDDKNENSDDLDYINLKKIQLYEYFKNEHIYLKQN